MSHRSQPEELIRQSPNWDRFFSALAADTTAAALAGEAFERLTQLYLQTQPEYRTKLKSVWRVPEEIPNGVRERLRLPSTDEGIDLIAETFDGEYWAIQCKFRSNTNTPLTYRELSTFTSLAFVTCRGISLAVVAHTCAKPVKKQELLGNTTEIGLDRWLTVDDEVWRAIQASVEKKPVALQPRAPRPHQAKAIEAATKHFHEGGAARGRLIMPCGTGKSLTAFWIAQSLDARTILVAVPSLNLIKQSLTDWTREFLAYDEIPDWLCVCSDESTGAIERDEFVGGIYDLGIDATTRQSVIVEFLRRTIPKRKIVFVTYQSGSVLGQAAREARTTFDLGIMDEAHRTVGGKHKSFAHLLDSKNIDIRQRLFMTATERVVRGADEDVLSMDDPDVYGDRFFQMSFKQAIEADPPIICDYRILTITVSDQRIRELIEENRYLTVSGAEATEREAQALAAGIALQRAFREHGVRHAISFHRSIRAADDFRDQHEAIVQGGADEIRPKCFQVSSRKTAGERTALLKAFRDSPVALISNARCQQEGVDIPAVDCVLFADPKQSVVDIVQAAGRALRPYPGKRCGFVIVPIIVPSDMDFAEFAESTAFKQVARVITALSTQDDRIAEEFRAIGARKRATGQVVEIRGDVPIGYHASLADLREQISLRLWKSIGRANWRPFEEARAFAVSLGLESKEEWIRFCRSDALPIDIPSFPDHVYRNDGWIGWGNWLGTGNIAPSQRRYRPFLEAREFVQSLGLKSEVEWERFCKSGKKPDDIPASPSSTYRDKGWIGLGDWLGTGNIAPSQRRYRPFLEARGFVQSLGLKSEVEWEQFCKSGTKPDDIPASPSSTYRDKGWIGLGDWLGTGNIAPSQRRYRPFLDAREFVRSLGLKSQGDWTSYCKRGVKPADIPASPARVYAGRGWSTWGDWLGTDSVASYLRPYRAFEQAREFARSLGLKTGDDWKAFGRSDKMPVDIPAYPHHVYRNEGWISMGDWLGTGFVSSPLRTYRSFAEARTFAQSLGLKSQAEWAQYCKTAEKPTDLPNYPDHVYRDDGWKGWGDWLGTGSVAPSQRQFRPFIEARVFVRSLGLRSGTYWKRYCASGQLPNDIPTNPSQTYRDEGWAGMGDWLGTGNIAPSKRTYKPFPEAREFARRLGLKSANEWTQFSKSPSRPADIPSMPARVYRNQGWRGWGDWLGTGAVAASARSYRPFEESRAYARTLGLTSRKDWNAYFRTNQPPPDTPLDPRNAYGNDGWAGWADWLGTRQIRPSRKK